MPIVRHIDNFSYTLTGAKPSSQGYVDESGFITALETAVYGNPAVTGLTSGFGSMMIPVTAVDSDGTTILAVGWLVKWDSGVDNKVYFSTSPEDTLTSTGFAAGVTLRSRWRADLASCNSLATNFVDEFLVVDAVTSVGVDLATPHTVITLDSSLTATTLQIHLGPSWEKFTTKLSSSEVPYNLGTLEPYLPRYTAVIDNQSGNSTFGLTFTISSSFVYDTVVWESGSAPAFDASHNRIFVEFLLMGGWYTNKTWLGRSYVFNE